MSKPLLPCTGENGDGVVAPSLAYDLPMLPADFVGTRFGDVDSITMSSSEEPPLGDNRGALEDPNDVAFRVVLDAVAPSCVLSLDGTDRLGLVESGKSSSMTAVLLLSLASSSLTLDA